MSKFSYMFYILKKEKLNVDVDLSKMMKYEEKIEHWPLLKYLKRRKRGSNIDAVLTHIVLAFPLGFSNFSVTLLSSASIIQYSSLSASYFLPFSSPTSSST